MMSLLNGATNETSTSTIDISIDSSKDQLCQECDSESFRYQCPRCSHRTCSLQCCVAHKHRTGCNGKRDRTKFLRVAHMDDGTLNSDYHFLEDVLGAVERAKRTTGTNNSKSNNQSNKRHKPNEHNTTTTVTPHSMLQQMEHLAVDGAEKTSPAEPSNSDITTSTSQLVLQSTPTTTTTPPNNNTNNDSWKQLGPKWRHFFQQAKLRGTHVLLMPTGMQRRKTNSSHIQKKDDIIHWKVDFRMHCDDKNAEVIVHSQKISEQAVLWEELQKMNFWKKNKNHTDNTIDDTTTGTPTIHCLMIQKLPSPSNRPCYVEISDKQATLQSILHGMTIIEYPTIEVVCHPDRVSDFPKAIQEVFEATTTTKDTKNDACSDTSS
ncbi:Box C/D snoRNA protein 1 [Seminavis robusta]|uniref:Box C/D snoRNA protein 1 n=1 Tax=Seminavis robusta TaxID=568900 RepID=A0A9N8DQ62_9STRA|nr:Box C/D snoRNA protein 1 [Seminavis robusta]|eukprot:Sro180_g078670.1 Box C/D snoRNA protein 1 (377) ;mRNA; r:17146-18276